MKAKELRDLTYDALVKKESDLQAELFNLRFRLATGQLDNPMMIKSVRKDMARVKTVIRQKDMEKAVQYYRQGVAAGCDDCMTALAVCLLNGDGTEQDEAEALRLLKQAANMGNPDALEELQKLKRDVGDGVNPTAK